MSRGVNRCFFTDSITDNFLFILCWLHYWNTLRVRHSPHGVLQYSIWFYLVKLLKVDAVCVFHLNRFDNILSLSNVFFTHNLTISIIPTVKRSNKLICVDLYTYYRYLWKNSEKLYGNTQVIVEAFVRWENKISP